jgi:low temperature requirement protein LtrA
MKERTPKQPHPAPLWWGPPKKFSERKNERKIGWLELFYDLVYVAAISQLTHAMSQHCSWETTGLSFLFFSFVFWSWVNGSQYYDLHGSDSIRTRLVTFWQILAVAAVGVTMQDAFNGHHVPLAIALIIVQLIITYLWWSIGLYDPGHRKFSIFYTSGYLAATALLLVSVFTTFHIAIFLWVIALLFNFSPPFTAAKRIQEDLKQRNEVYTASAALVERFGLFTIIVLAESILAIVGGVGEMKDKGPLLWITFIIAILITFLIWSLYFDMTSEQETKKGYNYMQLLMFLHYPILASLGILGASIRILIADANPIVCHDAEWMFCISLAVILFGIIGITTIMEEDEESRAYIKPVNKILFVAGILIISLPFFGLISTFTFLSIIVCILFVPVFIGIRHWVKYKFFNAE